MVQTSSLKRHSPAGTALTSTTALVTGTTYYASQTVGTCESTRTAVAVSINDPQITASATTVCAGMAVNLVISSNLISTTEGTAYVEIPEGNSGVLQAPAGALFKSVNFAGKKSVNMLEKCLC